MKVSVLLGIFATLTPLYLKERFGFLGSLHNLNSVFAGEDEGPDFCRHPDVDPYHGHGGAWTKHRLVQRSTTQIINVEPSRQSPRRRHPRFNVSPLPPDVVEPWGSSHGELSRSPHSPGDVVATPQVVIGKRPSEYINSLVLAIFSTSLRVTVNWRCHSVVLTMCLMVSVDAVPFLFGGKDCKKKGDDHKPPKKDDCKDNPPKSDDDEDDPPKKDDCKDKPPKKDDDEDDPPKKDDCKDKPPKKDDDEDDPPKKDDCKDKPPKKDDCKDKPPNKDDCKDDPPKKDDCKDKPPKKDDCKDKPPNKDDCKDDPPKKDDCKDKPPKKDDCKDKPPKKDDCKDKPPKKDDCKDDPPKKHKVDKGKKHHKKGKFDLIKVPFL